METLNTIPSEQDWGNYKDDLDQEYAHRVFFGKSLDETIPAFERNVIERCSELQFMPLIPFRYYMLALRNYVMSQQTLSNEMVPDAGSCFLRLVLLKLRENPKSILPIMEALLPAIEYVANNQTLFDADIDIYGDFVEKFAEIRAAFDQAKSSHSLG